MQIDYRVWDKENKKMINVLAKDYYGPDLMYTGYLDSEKARLLEWDNSNEIKVILMPYIGKKDKCGTKAYEKDIIEYKAFDLLNKEILFRGFTRILSALVTT